MILNDSRLPPFVIGNLYKSCLVDLNSEAKKKTKKKEFPYMGGNNRLILFLVNNDDVPFLPDKQLDFLSGILSACKLNMEDIAIANLARIPGSDHKDVIELSEAEIIILFGIDTPALGLPFKIPEFQVQLFKKRKYLFAPDLHTIENDQELKKKLWHSLKNMFSI